MADTHKTVYGFEALEIGETMRLDAPPDSMSIEAFRKWSKKVRVAATMYGTRYGVWLSVRQAADKQGVTVTRTEVPPGESKQGGAQSARKRKNHIAAVTVDQFRRIEDALRALTLLVLDLKTTAEAIEDRLEH